MKASTCLKGTFGALVLAAFVASASADPIKITTLDITQFPEYGDGHVQIWITDAINDWNVSHDPDLPIDENIVGPTPNLKVVIPDGPGDPDVLQITLTGLDAYTYIFFHWGGPNADATYPNPELFYLNGVSEWTFNAPINSYYDKNGNLVRKQYGLSFYSVYGVPDGGTTVLMLGATVLLALGVSRRLTRKAKV